MKKSTQVAAPEPDLVRSDPEPIVPTPLRRSGRVPRQPDRYYGFLVRDGDPIELDENDEDPITYMNAMQRSDLEKWLEAIKSEMESMKVKMCGHWLTHPKE